MSNFITLILDTTAPANPFIQIEGGSQFTADRLVDVILSTSDTDTTGYQMKIWGSVDNSYDADVQTIEDNARWISYSTSKQIRLSEGDGTKTLFLRIRDDVHNVSSQASATISLDTTMPDVTMTEPDVKRISLIDGKRLTNFSFTVNQNFAEYKVKVVGNAGASHDTGTQIGTAYDSSNMSGTGSFTGGTPINCTIDGRDLETASSGDGEKFIKVFARDHAGNWSA